MLPFGEAWTGSVIHRRPDTLGRAAQRWNLLLPQRSPNHHRRMEETLQHQETTQCTGLPSARPWNHYPNGTQADHALTIKMDQSDQATQDKPQRHQHQMIATQMSFTSVTIFLSQIWLSPCLDNENAKGRSCTNFQFRLLKRGCSAKAVKPVSEQQIWG